MMQDTIKRRRRTSRRVMAKWVADWLTREDEVTIGGLNVRPFRDPSYEHEIRTSLQGRVEKILGKPVKVKPYYNANGTLTSLVVSLA